MNKKVEVENTSATITELVAKTKQEDSQFFKSKDEKEEAPAVIHDVNTSGSQQDSRKVFIKEILRKNNMLVTGSGLAASFSDEYRRIKRPLLSNIYGKSASLMEKSNLILVTSSIPGEGKTHTAINLALSIAHEKDHTVLLVDCDITRHGSSLLLGVSDKMGLIDVLENDDISVGDAILRTDIPELCLISSGKQDEYVTELLASQRMSAFVEEIGERYDDRIIIFDGPPLLPTPQAQVLANLVGQVVFIVEAGKTPQALVEEALAMIPSEQATGLVMNKREGLGGNTDSYYGYYGSS